MANWTVGQWNVEMAPQRNGAPLTGVTSWTALQPGLTHVRVRLDITNAGAFTNPFDLHPFNNPADSIDYLIETSVDGTDANAGYLAGGKSFGSANGTWPRKGNPNMHEVEASADLPQTPYPGFYRARYTASKALAFGVSVLPT